MKTEKKEEVKVEANENKAELKKPESTKESGKEVSQDIKEISQDSESEKKIKEERLGIAYIYATFNNTMVHITDLSGNTISRITGGMITKHDRLKSNPTIAMFVAKKAAERAKDLGITSLYIRTRGQTGGLGMGPGAHAAIAALGKEGFKIINILDTTRVPRGGPKKKGGKRGRRV